jgi:hypothetical protein
MYELRIPFKTTHVISEADAVMGFEVDRLKGRLVARPPYTVVTLGPFSSIREAEEYLPRAWGALAWACVERGLGFDMETKFGDMTVPDDAEEAGRNLARTFNLESAGPVHGLGDEGWPHILEIGKTYKFVGLGTATVTVSEPAARFLPCLAQSLENPATAHLFDDERLRTAIQLFSDSHREVSLRSRFLTYVIALEVLTRPRAKHQIALDLLDRWEQGLKEALARESPGSAEFHALESLRREVIFRRVSSLRSRVRELVLSSLTHLADDDRVKRATQAVDIYDLRGSLVHDGHVDPQELSRAADIARLLLLDVLRARSGMTPKP